MFIGVFCLNPLQKRVSGTSAHGGLDIG